MTNWGVNIVMANGALAPPPKESWSRPAHRATVLPYARRFTIPGCDIQALVETTPQGFEYPMCDRGPLPRWTFERVTLLGDAAHPMYPVGSNEASLAILDARALAAAEHPMPGALALRAGAAAENDGNRPPRSRRRPGAGDRRGREAGAIRLR